MRRKSQGVKMSVRIMIALFGALAVFLYGFSKSEDP